MNKKKQLDKNLIKEVSLVAFFFFFGGIVMLILMRFTPLIDVITKTSIYEKNSLASSVEKIYDAVVVVESFEKSSLEDTGTGFIYKKDAKYGYILTNEHVISKSDEVKVITSKDEEVTVKVLGKDEYLDLAVLRIEKKYVSLVAKTSSSKEVNLGDTIFTVGSPLGTDYRGSVTSGVLSGKDRLVSLSVDSSDENDWRMRVLQVDASVNPGNSGGPLLNVEGEVIGICSLKLVDNNIEGMSFAIPIEYALSHVDYLEKGKKIEWPVLGIDMINVTDTAKLLRSNISIDKNIKEGVAVEKIKEKSAATKSNLKKGDIITQINGIKIKDIAYLKYELYRYKAGDTIEVTFTRNGKEKSTKVVLSKNS